MTFLERAEGCLLGGAAGDALGYAVEFDRWDAIERCYGSQGIQEYADHPARISDDTQMTLFTAVGLLNHHFHAETSPAAAVYDAYLDWLDTQDGGFLGKNVCWIKPEIAVQGDRAPGMTCLSALRSGKMGSIDEPINHSKGCGGIMRVAPVALYGHRVGWDIEKVTRVGAETAAITHGHPLGWLSAAAMANLLYRLLDGATVSEAAESCAAMLSEIFPEPESHELTEGMRRAAELARNDASDLDNIRELGEGWVGEEALYIALYCALRHEDDFDAALRASVNHDGDSDSTGAVLGNLLGARLGIDSIAPKWTDNVESAATLRAIAADLNCPDPTKY